MYLIMSISAAFLPLLLLFQRSYAGMSQEHLDRSKCCTCRTATEPRCGDTEMCCGIDIGFECTQWEDHEHVCYRKASGEFFLPDGSYGNDKTGVLVYSDGTHEMFDVMDTQHNMEQLSELRVRDEEDPDYESSSSVPEDNTSPTSAPSIEEPVEHNTHPVETAPDVSTHDHPDSEHSEEPKLEEPQSEESEDPENPEITGEEDPEQPSHSIDSQGEESSLPHKPNANETAPTKTDFPDATEVDLPYSPSFTALHTSYDSKINSSMTQTLMEPPTKPTSDVATSMPEGHMSSQPLSTYSTATSTKVANITGNTFATSVPESDDLAVPLLARIEWVYICMLLGLLDIF